MDYCSKLDSLPVDAHNKVLVLLVLLGKKPASTLILTSEKWLKGHARLEYDQKRLALIESSLRELGLQTMLAKEVTDKGISQTGPTRLHELVRLSVSSEVAILELLQKGLAEDDRKLLGRLYGFPPSAVSAFLEGRGLSFTEAKPHLAPEEYAYMLFRPSNDSFEQEMSTVKIWSNAVKTACPKLHSDFIRNG